MKRSYVFAAVLLLPSGCGYMIITEKDRADGICGVKSKGTKTPFWCV